MKKNFCLIPLLILFAVCAFASDSVVEKFNSSMVYESRGDYTKAIDDMESLYAKNKNDYLINLRLGWLYYTTGKSETAKNHYQNAIRLNPRSVEARLGLTLPLSKLSEWEQVEQTYQEILNIDFYNYTANLRLGQIYLNRGDFSKAEKYLNTVVELYPSDYESNLSSAWNNYSLGESDKARAEFRQVLMISPLDSSATRGMDLLK